MNVENDKAGICKKKLLAVIFVPSLLIIIVVGLFMFLGYNEISIAAAGVITVIGSFVGGCIIGFVISKKPDYLIQGVQGMIFSRLVLTVIGILICVLLLNIRNTKFFFFTGGFYLIGLISETRLVVKMVREGLLAERNE